MKIIGGFLTSSDISLDSLEYNMEKPPVSVIMEIISPENLPYRQEKQIEKQAERGLFLSFRLIQRNIGIMSLRFIMDLLKGVQGGTDVKGVSLVLLIILSSILIIPFLTPIAGLLVVAIADDQNVNREV
jgi:membrane glycosyltransferase